MSLSTEERNLQRRADKLVANEVFCHVGGLVEQLNEYSQGQFTLDHFNPDPTDEQIKEFMSDNDIEDEEDARDQLRDQFEPLEYWAVSEWLANKLLDAGECVTEVGLTHIWARTTSGQAIAIDYVIEKITKATEYASTLED